MCCMINDAHFIYGMITIAENAETKEAIKEAIKREYLLDSYLTIHLDISRNTIQKYPFIKTLFYKGLIKRFKAQGK